jgi:hypothetical protein
LDQAAEEEEELTALVEDLARPRVAAVVEVLLLKNTL